MKANTLISCADFVLRQDETLEFMNDFDNKCQAFDRILDYANFLKCPITLGQFVPTDLEGNVLIEPKKYVPISTNPSEELRIDAENEYNYEFQKYKEALERVLFEGFEIIEYPEANENEVTKVIKFKNTYAFHFKNGEWNLGIGLKTIECLINRSLTLTDSISKEFGLTI